MTRILNLDRLVTRCKVDGLIHPWLPAAEKHYPELHIEDHKQIAACLYCLHGVPLSAKPNEDAYQYRMKHIVEKTLGNFYIHSDSFHRAAKLACVPYTDRGRSTIYAISNAGLSFMARHGVVLVEQYMLPSERGW